MHEHRISCHLAQGTATFSVEGKFDRAAACALGESVEASGADRLVIDFSRVHSFCDLAIGVLSDHLSAHPLALRGLAEHQERVFRYLGIQSAEAKRPSGDC